MPFYRGETGRFLWQDRRDDQRSVCITSQIYGNICPSSGADRSPILLPITNRYGNQALFETLFGKQRTWIGLDLWTTEIFHFLITGIHLRVQECFVWVAYKYGMVCVGDIWRWSRLYSKAGWLLVKGLWIWFLKNRETVFCAHVTRSGTSSTEFVFGSSADSSVFLLLMYWHSWSGPSGGFCICSLREDISFSSWLCFMSNVIPQK